VREGGEGVIDQRELRGDCCSVSLVSRLVNRPLNPTYVREPHFRIQVLDILKHERLRAHILGRL
jgi:hypothetical protein